MGFSAMVLSIGGAANSAIGSYYGAATQKATLKGQAEVADVNARIAELGAQSALNQGQQEVGRMTMQAGKVKSAQRAAMAANGIDLGEGNAAEVQATTDTIKEIDANTITANAVRSAFGYRTQAVNFQNEALTKRATSSTVSPGMAVASSLLGSAASVAPSWYGMKQAGLFDKPSTGGIGSEGWESNSYNGTSSSGMKW